MSRSVQWFLAVVIVMFAFTWVILAWAQDGAPDIGTARYCERTTTGIQCWEE